MSRLRSLPPGAALFPLRLFLGATFVYAGIQKLADPGFLHPGAPTYIGTQLQGFADGTPGAFILRTFALPHPVVAGVGVAVLEIGIGLFAAAGLLTRIAAAAGLALNLLLFLTASWHTTPYFLGPDIVFVFAWLPFVLAGAAGQPALDHALLRPSPAFMRRATPGLQPEAITPERRATLTRRALVGELGVAALGLAGIAALAKDGYSAPLPAPGATASTGPAQTGGANGAGAGGGLPAGAVKLGASSQLGAQSAATYRDPGDGSADIVIRQPDGSLSAFSAVCTHAGCTVGYQGGVIACPCHGATYDPQTGAVTGGPAPAGLATKRVVERDGQIYALQS